MCNRTFALKESVDYHAGPSCVAAEYRIIYPDREENPCLAFTLFLKNFFYF